MTEYKIAKKPCRRCGSMSRYALSGNCPTCKRGRSTEWSRPNAMRCRDIQRRANARRGGYKPPPPEADCPPRPIDNRCQLCGRFTPDRPRGPYRAMSSGLDLDHCHDTGRFRGWICYSCNESIGKIEKFVGIVRLEHYLLGGALGVELHNALDGGTADAGVLRIPQR